MRALLLTLLVVVVAMSATCQITITGARQLPLPDGERWMAPGWAPDGRSFFVSASTYRGLWRFDLQAGTLAQITNDAGAGYGWTVSPDGAAVVYRRTIPGLRPGDRTQEIVRVDLATGATTSLTAGGSLEVPVFAGDALVVNSARQGYQALGNSVPAMERPAVLGIENTKIALIQNGQKVLLDPLGGGSYIWPSLSPDGTRLLAYEMARGAFICDLQGNILARLGRLDAPVWTRDGSWIISMREENDGHAITGSDLFATRPDGLTTVRLTHTPAIELMPACSPADNTILCSTADGTILLLTYEETGR